MWQQQSTKYAGVRGDGAPASPSLVRATLVLALGAGCLGSFALGQVFGHAAHKPIAALPASATAREVVQGALSPVPTQVTSPHTRALSVSADKTGNLFLVSQQASSSSEPSFLSAAGGSLLAAPADQANSPGKPRTPKVKAHSAHGDGHSSPDEHHAPHGGHGDNGAGRHAAAAGD